MIFENLENLRPLLFFFFKKSTIFNKRIGKVAGSKILKKVVFFFFW